MTSKSETVKSEVRLRDNIASFSGREFTTAELRKISCTHNLKTRLVEMSDNGEIKHVRRYQTVDVWSELKLVYPKFRMRETVIKKTDQTVNLEGWRYAFPDLFADIVHPWMPVNGVISNIADW